MPEKTLSIIKENLDAGNAISVNTGRSTIFITQKDFSKRPDMFFLDKEGSLRIRSGKKSKLLQTKGVSLVRICYHKPIIS